jgi:hypothetical protein
MRLICEVDPQPPTRLDPTVPRDLEAICLKALSKNPADRYASALAMADDLQRFLHRGPIMARTPGAAERLARVMRRRPAWLAASLLAFVTLALIGYQQFELQKLRLRLDTEDRRELRRAISRSYESELRRGVALGEKRIRDHSDTRDSRLTLASSYHRLGDLLINTDRLDDAVWAYARAVMLFRQHLRSEARDVAPRIELADVLGNFGEASWALRGARDAVAAYREALLVRRSLVADHPEVAAYQDDLTRTLNRLNQLSGKVELGTETHSR